MGEKEKVCVTFDLRFLNKERRGRESEDACEKERERERERERETRFFSCLSGMFKIEFFKKLNFF